MLYNLDILYILEIIKTKLITQHHNNLLSSCFKIQKTPNQKTKIVSLPIFYYNIEKYVKNYYIYITFKLAR